MTGIWFASADTEFLAAVADQPGMNELFQGQARAELDRRDDQDPCRPIAATPDGPRVVWGRDLAALKVEARRELLAEIDKALRSDGAAMHHSSCWRNAGFGEACGPADFASAGFMADFIAQRFKP